MAYLDSYQKNRTVSDIVGEIYSNVISIIAPGRSMQLDFARMSRREMISRGYDGAKKTRFNKNKAVTNGSQNSELLSGNAIGELRKKSRDQTRNNPIARSVKKALQAHIIGTGFTLQAGAVNSEGEIDEVKNKEIEKLWREWSGDKNNVDIRGKKDLNQFMTQCVGQYLDTGEYIINKLSDNTGMIPLKLESIDSDLLDDQYTDERKNIIGGIRISNTGRPIEYNFLKSSPTNSEVSRYGHTTINAKNIIHSYIEIRPSQLRGEPWLAPCLNWLETASRAVEAELYTLEIQACLSVVYNSKTGSSGDKFSGSQTSTEDDSGNRIGKLAPGAIIKMNGADNMQVVDPKRPGNSFAPFIDKIIQYVSASLDISYAKVAKDYSQGSFSSLRMGEQDDRRHLLPIQHLVVSDILKPIYAQFMDDIVLKGLINLPGYATNKNQYLKSIWIPQPHASSERLKDVAADMKEISGGGSTLKAYYESKGLNFEMAMKQIAEEQKYFQENDIQLSSFDPTKTQVQTASDMRSD